MLLTEEEKKDSINFKQPDIRSQKNNNILRILLIIIGITLLILLMSFIIFSIYVSKNTSIANGISIKNIDISGLTYEEAKSKVESSLKNSMDENITLQHNEYSTTINIEQVEAKFNITDSLDTAYNYTRTNNFLVNDLNTLKLYFNQMNIEPNLLINLNQLKKSLEDISSQLPDTVIESSYYIDENNLIITAGKTGLIVDVNKTANSILQSLYNLSYSNNTLEIFTESKKPQEIDIEKIHKEIYKEPINASYDENTHIVTPSENGLDFAISIEEINNMLKTQKDEYTIKLKTLSPNITTSMIGMEAFPDLLSTFSTRYVTSNKNRTTNLRLAANKINGTVIMPGETFSFNKIVGKRTIEAGYKDAAIYQDGKVVDGLAGGICQISSTLFNAVVYANLEITERRNHQFITSYLPAGRDATVVYGSQDFKFKNNRKYPVKIEATLNSGIAKISLYGVKEENDYTVTFETKTISAIPYKTKYIEDNSLEEGVEKIQQKGTNGLVTETYKILSLNGAVVSKTLLSKDTYNAMQRVVVKGTKKVKKEKEENNDNSKEDSNKNNVDNKKENDKNKQ